MSSKENETITPKATKEELAETTEVVVEAAEEEIAEVEEVIKEATIEEKEEPIKEREPDVTEELDPTKGSRENPDYTLQYLPDVFGLDQEEFNSETEKSLSLLMEILRNPGEGTTIVPNLINFLTNKDLTEVERSACILYIFNQMAEFRQYKGALNTLVMRTVQPLITEQLTEVASYMQTMRNDLVRAMEAKDKSNPTIITP